MGRSRTVIRFNYCESGGVAQPLLLKFRMAAPFSFQGTEGLIFPAVSST